MSMMPIDEEQGLLGGMMMDPRSMGLLNLGAGLLQASGPSRMPIGLGQAIGMALPQGIQGMQTAYAMKQQDEMNKLRRQQMQFELEALRRRQQEQEAERNSVMGFLDAQNPTTTMHRAPSPLPDAQNDNPMVPVTGVDPARLATARKDLIANSPSVRNAFVSGLFKEEQPYNLRPGERRMVGDRMISENPAAPKETQPPEIIRLMESQKQFPPGSREWMIIEDKLKKERTHQPAASTVFNSPKENFKNEKSLREEFTTQPTVKAASEMNTAFKMIDAAYKRPSAANDLAMATKYMKILDPTSVVRESEFALAVNATGVMDKVLNYANMITTGQRLNPTQRKDFYDSAKAINDAFQGEARRVANEYEAQAKRYGLDPSAVTFGINFAKPEPKAPKAGDVIDGYKFKGGNPGDRNNWEKT